MLNLLDTDSGYSDFDCVSDQYSEKVMRVKVDRDMQGVRTKLVALPSVLALIERFRSR